MMRKNTILVKFQLGLRMGLLFLLCYKVDIWPNLTRYMLSLKQLPERYIKYHSGCLEADPKQSSRPLEVLGRIQFPLHRVHQLARTLQQGWHFSTGQSYEKPSPRKRTVWRWRTVWRKTLIWTRLPAPGFYTITTLLVLLNPGESPHSLHDYPRSNHCGCHQVQTVPWWRSKPEATSLHRGDLPNIEKRKVQCSGIGSWWG